MEGAGATFGTFFAVRLVLFVVRHEPFWTVPLWSVGYAATAFQILAWGRRRQLGAEIKRLEAERAHLVSALVLVMADNARQARLKGIP